MAPRNDQFDMGAMLSAMAEAGKPLMAKLEKIEDRISTQATKIDLEKVREEVLKRVEQIEKNISSSYVPRDLYETRHAQLIERDSRIEQAIRDFGAQMETWKGMQEGRLQSAKREIDDRFVAVESRFKDEREVTKQKFEELEQQKSGRWERILTVVGLVLSGVAVAVATLSFVLQHVHVQ